MSTFQGSGSIKIDTSLIICGRDIDPMVSTLRQPESSNPDSFTDWGDSGLRARRLHLTVLISPPSKWWVRLPAAVQGLERAAEIEPK